MKRILFALLILFLFAFVYLAYDGYLEDGKGVVKIGNTSEELIVSINVEVIGVSSIKVGPLAPASEITMEFTTGRDSHYLVEVEFLSGKRLSTEFGYVTAGIVCWDTIAVSEQGIEVVESSSLVL